MIAVCLVQEEIYRELRECFWKRQKLTDELEYQCEWYQFKRKAQLRYEIACVMTNFRYWEKQKEEALNFWQR